MKTKLFAASLLLSTLVFAACAQADTVTLVPAPFFPSGLNVNTLAGPISGSDFDDLDVPGPGMGSVSSALLGNTATHGYELDVTYGPGLAFSKSFWGGFSRTSTDTHRATAESILHFMVATPTAYAIAGSFAVTDAVGTTIPGLVELESKFELLDAAMPFSIPPALVYHSYQVSDSTLGESFTIGGMGGDDTNLLFGPSSGLLIPGRIYRLRTLVTINALSTTNGGATAAGEHSITFTAIPVPEPGMGVGLVVLTAVVTSVRQRFRDKK